MKRITRDDLRGLYAPAPESMYDGIRAALAPLPEGKERPIVKKKVSISILLAAALVVMGMTALAVSQLNLFRQMSERESPLVPLQGADSMVVTNLGQAENDHAILTVEEAVYDGMGVMVLARLTPKDAEHTAMYASDFQDAPDDVYDKAMLRPRVYPTGAVSTREDGSEIFITSEGNHKELWVDDAQVEIPDSREAALAANLPVYMDDGVLRWANQPLAMDVVGRKDGRAMIDYDLKVDVSDADGSPMTCPTAIHNAEGQDDGGALIWFNGFAEQVMSDSITLTLSGETVLDGETLPLNGLSFSLQRVEPERKLTLIPENDDVAGRAHLTSASITLTKVRGYFNLEYDLTCDPYDVVSFRLLDDRGRQLNEGWGWMESWSDHCAEQFEFQAFDEIPESLTLEARDADGHPIAQCVCRVVEEN